MSEKYIKLLRLSKNIKKLQRVKSKKQKRSSFQDNIVEYGEKLQDSINIEKNKESCFKIDERKVIILLELEQYALVNANYTLKVQKGSVSCFGYTINSTAQEYQIYSSGRTALPIRSLETTQLTNEIVTDFSNQLQSQCNISDETKLQFQKWLKSFHCGTMILLVFQNQIIPESIQIADDLNDIISPYSIQYPQEFDLQFEKYVIPTHRSHHMRKKIMIIGEKNTGKSLMSIHLMNQFLSYSLKSNLKESIYYLESDLGQNSFFVPGTVGLFHFQEPIFHNLQSPCQKKPLTYDYIGEYSPFQNVIPYLNSVQKAMDCYYSQGMEGVLIINTHGYIQNIGENILYDLIRVIEPDVALILGKENLKAENKDGYLHFNPTQQIESEIRRRTFHERASFLTKSPREEYKNPFEDYKGPQIWRSEIPQITDIASKKKDNKDAMIVSYLISGIVEQEIRFPRVSKLSQLAFIRPIEMNFDNFLHVVVGGSKAKFFLNQEILKYSMIFIASLVSLNQIPLYQVQDFNNLYQQQLEELVDKSISKGFGFIRDIDIKKRIIYIVTPLKNVELASVNLIFKSSQAQLSKEFFKEEADSGIEHWLQETKLSEEGQKIKPTKLFNNECIFGVGSESYRSSKSLRKIQ